MKPHTNHYKSLHCMKVGFGSYAWNFSFNVMHLKYILKFQVVVVLNMEQRLLYSVAGHHLTEITRNYTRPYHSKLFVKTLDDCCVGLFFEMIFCENDIDNSEKYVCGLHTKPPITQTIQNVDHDELKQIWKETVTDWGTIPVFSWRNYANQKKPMPKPKLQPGI